MYNVAAKEHVYLFIYQRGLNEAIPEFLYFGL